MNIFPLIAIGTCTTNTSGKILDIRYESLQFKDDVKASLESSTFNDFDGGYHSLLKIYDDYKDKNYQIPFDYDPEVRDIPEEEKNKIRIIHKLDSDEPIRDVKDAYLKLYLLSKKWAVPNSLNLEGIFSALPSVAWTNHGPMDPNELEELRQEYDYLYVRSLDKFPCLTDYIIPKGVRIADASRVRLGAYLSEGTTVMHEGFVNFNAGTLGTAMIEGRISAGVVIGANSDLGGGCSTMGTLSGGNDVKISVGEDCLLGANSGLGIPLGDRCVLEAGLYLTAGTRVELITSKNEIKEVKASELAFNDDLLFIRNSLTGTVQCKPNSKTINLNEELHSNN